jgi:hypothetical protein
MTALEIASAIRNRVYDGLSGVVSDQSISTMQLYDEIDLVRADFVNKYAMTSKLNTKYLLQSLDNLEIKCTSLAYTDACDEFRFMNDAVPALEIPPLLPTPDDSAIEYLGLTNKQDKFAVYYSTSDIQNHKYRIKTKNRPYVWVDTTLNANSKFTAYFFNLGKYNALRYVSLRAMFNHPSSVLPFDPDYLEKEYAAPAYMQMAILDAVTEKYIRYYRQMHTVPQPNTQTDNIQ